MNKATEEIALRAGFIKVNGIWKAGPTASLAFFTDMIVTECIKTVTESPKPLQIATTYDMMTFEYVRDEIAKNLKERMFNESGEKKVVNETIT